MSDLVHLLTSPAFVDAMQHLADDLTNPTQIVTNIGNSLEGELGTHFAAAVIEKIVRFGKANLAAESAETVEVSLERIGLLYSALADRVLELERHGKKVDAETFRAVFAEPRASATLTAATAAAVETDDEITIGALSRLIVTRLAAGPTSNLSLRIRQASESVKAGLTRREMHVLGQLSIIISQSGIANFGLRSAGPIDQQRVIAWYEKNVPLIVTPRASHIDTNELQARGLIILAPNAADYDARFAPHGSSVARVWQRIGGGGNTAYPSRSMALLEQLEFGSDHNGERAFETPALGAFQLTEAGHMLGIVYLQQIGVHVPAKFSEGHDVNVLSFNF